MIKILFTLTTVLMMAMSLSTFARDCESDLADTMEDIKDSMKKINRFARRDDKDSLAYEVDKAIELVSEAKNKQPMIYAELSADELEDAKDYFSKGMDELETLLLSLKDADLDQVDEILNNIKSLQKKSHRKLKEC